MRELRNSRALFLGAFAEIRTRVSLLPRSFFRVDPDSLPAPCSPLPHSNGRGTSQRDGDRGQHAGFVQCRSALKCGLGSRPAFEFVLFWGGAVRSGPTRGASFNCQMAIKKKFKNFKNWQSTQHRKDNRGHIAAFEAAR